MTNGFTDIKTDVDTPNDFSVSAKPLKNPLVKPLKNPLIKTGRVDINKLKAKLQESESKEFKKNISILSILVIGVGVVGIYLSL